MSNVNADATQLLTIASLIHLNRKLIMSIMKSKNSIFGNSVMVSQGKCCLIAFQRNKLNKP